MKRIFSLALAVVMLASVMLTLTSCGSKYPSIEKNFVNAGFEVVDTTNDEGKNYLSVVATLKEGDVSCTVHVLKKGTLLGLDLAYAIIAEYGADADVLTAWDEYSDGAAASVFEDLDKSKIINGNCMLIPIQVGAKTTVNDMIELFNK